MVMIVAEVLLQSETRHEGTTMYTSHKQHVNRIIKKATTHERMNTEVESKSNTFVGVNDALMARSGAKRPLQR